MVDSQLELKLKPSLRSHLYGHQLFSVLELISKAIVPHLTNGPFQTVPNPQKFVQNSQRANFNEQLHHLA